MSSSNNHHRKFRNNRQNRSPIRRMDKMKLALFTFLISIVSLAQNGINYKAVIKDNLGNVVANELIQVQFSILQSAAQTNVYQETHTPTTDANGMIIVNIGAGSTSDDFTAIDWASDDHFLKVKIDTGSGLVDLGTTQFMQVPYAIQAEKAANVTGLEAIDEGNGIGWRLVGRDSTRHGSIGFNALDLTYSSGVSSIYGATNNYDVAMGLGTTASGGNSTAMGVFTEALAGSSTAMGISTTASGIASTALGRTTAAIGNYSTSLGQFSNAIGDTSTAMGRTTIASGSNSTSMGFLTRADSYASLAIGRFNTGGGNPTSWVDNEPLFQIGNGTSESNRSNALTVYKNGYIILNSSSSGLQVSSDGPVGISIGGAGNDYGIHVGGANFHGGSFRGELAGIYASSTIQENPDIILGNRNSNDGGVISSDPIYPSSELYLRSNDNVIVELDHDDSGFSFFRVMNGDNEDVFSVSEGGAIRQNGATIHSSDKRLKKDIENLQYGLNEILQLQPKTYRWKNKNQTEKSLGLIAQEVLPIIKEIVVAQDDTDKTLGINYTELIPVLIKAIQEQQKIIKTQDSKIDGLTAELNQLQVLEKRIKTLEMSSNSSK